MSINRAETTLEDTPARASSRRWIWAAVAAGLALAAALGVSRLMRPAAPPPPPPPPLRLAWSSPDGLAIGGGSDHPFGLALAPDGRRLAYPAARDGDAALWLADLTTGRSEALPGTDAGVAPFWSPDGRRLGFFSGDRLRILDLEGGRIDDGGEALAAGGGAWLPAGDVILAAPDLGGLVRYRVSDRQATPLTTVDRAADETAHRLPIVSADGAHVIFYVEASGPGRSGIWLTALDRPAERVRLTGSDAQGILAGDALLYSVDGSLVAQRLDLEQRALVGRPELVTPAVGIGPSRQLFVTASRDVIAYAGPASDERELVWTDRGGAMTGTLAGPVHAWTTRIAPDGDSVAVTRTDPQLATLDVWVYDIGRPMPRRISPSLDVDDYPVWAPDGIRLAWISARTQLLTRGRQALLPEDRVRRFDGRARLWDWTRSNRFVVGLADASTRDDLWIVNGGSDEAPTPYARSPFNETQAVVSPNGSWLAYASDESGRSEIYVDRFPQPGARVRVTADGGQDPRWRADGREIIFRRGDGLYAVAIASAGATIEARETTRLFSTARDVRAYDVTRDGQRFVLNRPMPGARPLAVQIIVDWQLPPMPEGPPARR